MKRRKKKFTLLFLFLIILISIISIGACLAFTSLAKAQEQTAAFYNEFDIIGNKIFVKQTFIFEQPTFQTFFLELPKDATNLEIKINNESISQDEIKARLTETKQSKRIELTNSYEIKIKYSTKEFLEQNKKSFFLMDFKIPLDVKEFQLKLTLPQGNLLDKPLRNSAGSAWPKPVKLETDGQKIWLTWTRTNLKKDDSISFLVVYKKEKELMTWILILIIIIIVIVIAFILFMKKIKKKKKITKKKVKIKEKVEKKVFEHLLESERAIISLLKTAKRKELWQKQIRLKTGFSKAKLSRVIKNLEARGIVKKIPIGNTNKIKLVS